MDIKIEEQDNVYFVYVKIEEYNVKEKRKKVVTTRQVRREVASRGYDIGNTLQEDRLHNANGITQGTWAFEKKVLDKVEESVIIEEEKVVKPKPTRKKRTTTRASTKKKTSTEE